MADKKPASRLVEQGKKVRFRPDKKPRKCLSVPQAVYPHNPRLSAPTVSVPQAVYLHSPRLSAPTAFIRTVSLFRTNRVCLRRTRLPLAVFSANETPRV